MTDQTHLPHLYHPRAKPQEENPTHRAWLGQLLQTGMKKLTQEIDQWLRRRLKMVTWKRRIPNGTYGAVGGQLAD